MLANENESRTIAFQDQKCWRPGGQQELGGRFLHLAQLPITKKIQAFSLASLFAINPCFAGTAMITNNDYDNPGFWPSGPS